MRCERGSCTRGGDGESKKKQRTRKEKLEPMEDSRLVKKVYTEAIAGKRPRGGPRKK